MNEEQQLKLQAFLDGELPEAEAREVARWIAADAAAADLARELRNTRQALSGFEAQVKLPESREFYWSKIQREIERQEPVAVRAEGPSLFRMLRRLLAPAGAVAAFAIVVIAALMQFGNLQQPLAGDSPDSETVSSDPAAFTYNDYASGTTLVWVSYPAESEFAPGSPN